MNTKRLFTASLAGGLISTVLVNLPYVNLINVFLCAGFWVGPFAAVWLYRHQRAMLTVGQAVLIGLSAGVWHGLFGLSLSAVGLAGAGGLLNDLRAVVPAAGVPDLEAALTSVGGLLFNLVGVLVDLIFGAVGGLIGGAILKASPAPEALPT